MSSTKGTTAEDLVYLGWFAGTWDCAAQLLKVELGPGGEATLDAALPGGSAALAEMAAAQGTEKGQKRAACRWKATDPAKNGVSAGFAVEEAGGICAGVVAAACAVAGPQAEVRPVDGGPSLDDVWEAKGQGGAVRSLTAVGSSGQPDASNPDSFRVSELFEVSAKPDREPCALVRVVTEYRRAPATKAGPIVEALQTALVLPKPATPGGDPGTKSLATFISLLVYKQRK